MVEFTQHHKDRNRLKSSKNIISLFFAYAITGNKEYVERVRTLMPHNTPEANQIELYIKRLNNNNVLTWFFLFQILTEDDLDYTLIYKEEIITLDTLSKGKGALLEKLRARCPYPNGRWIIINNFGNIGILVREVSKELPSLYEESPKQANTIVVSNKVFVDVPKLPATAAGQLMYLVIKNDINLFQQTVE